MPAVCHCFGAFRDQLKEYVVYYTKDVSTTHAKRAYTMSQQTVQREPHETPPPAPITYEEFLDWADEDTLAEWVDGEIVMTSPASLRHQQLAAFVFELLSSYTAVHDLGTVLNAPFQMKLPTSGREPDVLYVARAHEDRLRNTFLDGPADLVVEIVSPESVERDRVHKFGEYEAGGVSEYWLLDPRHERADFYQLNTRGRYQPIPADQDGVYRSQALPGFWLRVPWLWLQPLPPPVRALLEIDRDAYSRYLRDELRQADL